jgi:hypothetical protein
MEAVIATHPFHTLAFPGFYEAYPDVENEIGSSLLTTRFLSMAHLDT